MLKWCFIVVLVPFLTREYEEFKGKLNNQDNLINGLNDVQEILNVTKEIWFHETYGVKQVFHQCHPALYKKFELSLKSFMNEIEIIDNFDQIKDDLAPFCNLFEKPPNGGLKVVNHFDEIFKVFPKLEDYSSRRIFNLMVKLILKAKKVITNGNDCKNAIEKFRRTEDSVKPVNYFAGAMFRKYSQSKIIIEDTIDTFCEIEPPKRFDWNSVIEERIKIFYIFAKWQIVLVLIFAFFPIVPISFIGVRMTFPSVWYHLIWIRCRCKLNDLIAMIILLSIPMERMIKFLTSQLVKTKDDRKIDLKSKKKRKFKKNCKKQ